MPTEEAQLLRERFSRIRRIKMLLRPLPRKTNIHRYPVLRWFSATAREKAYLWSFRSNAMVPAFIAGSILSLLPIYGIQLPLAFLLALLLRANLPTFVGLQLITNPVTVAPIYFVNYHVARHFLYLFGKETPNFGRGDIRNMLERAASGEWGENIHTVLMVWSITALGGVIIGLFLGVVCSYIYRFMAWRTEKAYARLRELQRQREQETGHGLLHLPGKPHFLTKKDPPPKE